MTSETIQLPDGRTLGYALYGPKQRRPVLYFHGTPSSRLELLLCDLYGIPIEPMLEKYNLQLIAVDRPGMGLSDYDKHKTFLSFADDARYLLQQLNISRCQLLCWSGGGPFALAMAHQYPQVIQSVFIIAGFTCSFSEPGFLRNMHRNKVYFQSARLLPFLLRAALNFLKKRTSNRPVSQYLTGMPDADYALLKDPSTFQKLSELTLKEACAQSSRGSVQEAAMYFRDFGFMLRNISQPVHFWWGTEDRAVIRQHVEGLEKEISHLVTHYKEGEAHLSIYINCMEEVLGWLRRSEMTDQILNECL